MTMNITKPTNAYAAPIIKALMEHEKFATDRAYKTAKQIAEMVVREDGIADAIMCANRAIRDDAARRLWGRGIDAITKAVAEHPRIYDEQHAKCVVSVAAKEWVSDLYRLSVNESVSLTCAAPLTRAVKRVEESALREFIADFSDTVDALTGAAG